MHSITKETRSAGIVGLGISSSRILGYIRDMLIASRFGAGATSDAFFVAFMIPNLLRDLLAEGALSAAFIPIFTEYLTRKGRDDAWRLACRILNLLVVITLFIAVCGILLAPSILLLLPQDLIKGDTHLTMRLLQIMFPFIIFISISALMMGILNSLGRFGLPSIASSVLNVVMIFSILFLCPFIQGEPIIGLGVGVVLGALGGCLIQIPVLVGEGMRYHGTIGVRDEGVKRIAGLMIPRAIGAAAYQINTIVCKGLAWAMLSPGWVSCLYFAYRLFLLPVSLFGISLTTAIFPSFSKQVAQGDLHGLRESVSSSLRLLLFLTIPSMVGLMVIGKPIIRILFEHGRFLQNDTDLTYMALWFYSLGIFGYGGAKILSSCFYALKDTRTPVLVGLLCMGFNLVASLFLIQVLEGGGLALSTSISSMLNLSFLFIILRGRIGRFDGGRIFNTFLKVLTSSIGMGWICWNVASSLEWGIRGVFGGIVVGAVVFFLISKLLRTEEADHIIRMVWRR
jgi:putative peptidoglycan lipid II flippase